MRWKRQPAAFFAGEAAATVDELTSHQILCHGNETLFVIDMQNKKKGQGRFIYRDQSAFHPSTTALGKFRLHNWTNIGSETEIAGPIYFARESLRITAAKSVPLLVIAWLYEFTLLRSRKQYSLDSCWYKLKCVGRGRLNFVVLAGSVQTEIIITHIQRTCRNLWLPA